MSGEQMEAAIRRCYDEVWNKGNAEALDDISASDIVVHDSTRPGGIHGLDEYKRWCLNLLAFYPGWHLSVEELIVKDDKVVVRWVFQIPHTPDETDPQQAADKTVDGITVAHLVGQKAVEVWCSYDPHAAE